MCACFAVTYTVPNNMHESDISKCILFIISKSRGTATFSCPSFRISRNRRDFRLRLLSSFHRRLGLCHL